MFLPPEGKMQEYPSGIEILWVWFWKWSLYEVIVIVQDKCGLYFHLYKCVVLAQYVCKVVPVQHITEWIKCCTGMLITIVFECWM